jgi:hypothetical protein
MYDAGREGFATAAVNWPSDTVKVALIDTGVYTFSQTHDFWDDASAGLIGTAVSLASKTATSGVLDAADVTFTAPTGNSVEALIIYKDTGTASTSRLLLYLESDKVTGLPFTPNGTDVTLTWDNGSNKIAKI